MKVLVTGGSGFIGKHLVKRLLERGDEVVVVDLKPFPDPEVACVVGDLRERETVLKALTPGFDAVVHLAAITSVLQSVNDPEGVFNTNVLATHYLLERCREIGASRFVLASSNAVVGNVGSQIINESIPLVPLTPYGATKAAGEMLMSAYSASYQMLTCALRFTNIYGIGMQAKDSVVARMMKAALAGTGIQIYGDGNQIRDYLYVLDAVSSIELGLSLATSNTLTIGLGRSVSMNELYDLTCQATGVSIKMDHVEAKAGEMPAVIVDTTKARSLGFEVAYGLEDGLAATWLDFQQNN